MPKINKDYKAPTLSPTPEQIRALRILLDLSQKAAGAILGKSGRQWQKWEYGENKMDPIFFDYFLLKVFDTDTYSAYIRTMEERK